MQAAIDGIEDTLDAFEEAVTGVTTPDTSAARISAVRRRAIELRRCLAPQREVMVRLPESGAPVLGSDGKRACDRPPTA